MTNNISPPTVTWIRREKSITIHFWPFTLHSYDYESIRVSIWFGSRRRRKLEPWKQRSGPAFLAAGWYADTTPTASTEQVSLLSAEKSTAAGQDGGVFEAVRKESRCHRSRTELVMPAEPEPVEAEHGEPDDREAGRQGRARREPRPNKRVECVWLAFKPDFLFELLMERLKHKW